MSSMGFVIYTVLVFIRAFPNRGIPYIIKFPSNYSEFYLANQSISFVRVSYLLKVLEGFYMSEK